jgi:hypothetical protein
LSESEYVIGISKEDVKAIAKELNIPEDKIDWHTVEKYLEGYMFDGAYNVWDAIKDALRENCTQEV